METVILLRLCSELYVLRCMVGIDILYELTATQISEPISRKAISDNLDNALSLNVLGPLSRVNEKKRGM